MPFLYSLFFTLSIIYINPWGDSRGDIWTAPKVWVLVFITVTNLILLFKTGSKTVTFPRTWKIRLGLWLLFLTFGIISVFTSPFSDRAFFGQNEMGDGWLYWLLIACFTLTNNLLLNLHPELFSSQLQGLLAGGVVLALFCFPQVTNWHLDYAATMGQLLQENVLVSTVFQDHQPIGFYSHRGHAAFVLAMTGTLSLVAWQKRWLSAQLSLFVLVPTLAALLLTRTRMAWLAMLVATAYLLGRKYYKQLIPVALFCLLLVGITTLNRPIHGLPILRQITSDRIYLWQVATTGIQSRPHLGWGFDGFGIAYPHVEHRDKLKYSPC